MIKLTSIAALTVLIAAQGLANTPNQLADDTIIINNDMTNYWSTNQHKQFEFDANHPNPFFRQHRVDQDIERSIRELVEAGADVISFAPGLGSVPLWQSDYYSMEFHNAWWINTFEKDLICNEGDETEDGKKKAREICNQIGLNHHLTRYILNGGDMLSTLEEVAKNTSTKIVVSLRMNDLHHIDTLPLILNQDTPNKASTSQELSLFPMMYAQSSQMLSDVTVDCSNPTETVEFSGNYHQEIKIGLSRLDDCSHTTFSPEIHLFDWGKNMESYPLTIKDEQNESMTWTLPKSIVVHKQNLIKEIASRNIDGIELDFLRHPTLFNVDKTDLARRRNVTNAFLNTVNAIVEGRNKGLIGVRIPWKKCQQDLLGIEIDKLKNAGVDYVILGTFFYSEQPHPYNQAHPNCSGTPVQQDIAQLNESAGIPVYWESHYSSRDAGKDETSGDAVRRRMKDTQYYAAAHLANERGLQGVSLFNFHYFRKFNGEQGNWLSSPPYNIVRCLKDPQCVANKPHNYFLSGHKTPEFDAVERAHTFHIDMAPPEGGWSRNAIIRLQFDDRIPGTFGEEISVSINGTLTSFTSDNAKLFNPVYVTEHVAGNIDCNVNPTNPLEGKLLQDIGTYDEFQGCMDSGYYVYRKFSHVLKDGLNSVEVTYSGNEPVNLIFLEVSTD